MYSWENMANKGDPGWTIEIFSKIDKLASHCKILDLKLWYYLIGKIDREISISSTQTIMKRME